MVKTPYKNKRASIFYITFCYFIAKNMIVSGYLTLKNIQTHFSKTLKCKIYCVYYGESRSEKEIRKN